MISSESEKAAPAACEMLPFYQIIRSKPYAGSSDKRGHFYTNRISGQKIYTDASDQAAELVIRRCGSL